MKGLSRVKVADANEAMDLFRSSIYNRSYIEHQLEDDATAQ